MMYMVFFFFILFNRISAIMDHVQTFYFLESMVTKLHFTTLSMDHSSGYTFKANGKGLEYVKNITLKCFIFYLNLYFLFFSVGQLQKL